MATLRIPALLLATATVLSAAEPVLDRAEVRIPYPDLRQLLETERAAAGPELMPALLSARLRLSVGDDRTPAIDARFRAVRFSDRLSLVPLIGGDLALESHDPAEARLVVRDQMICHVGETAGDSEIRTRLRGLGDETEFSIVLPACPTIIFETGELPGNSGVSVTWTGHRRTMAAGQQIILPTNPGVLTIRLMPKAPEKKRKHLPVVDVADAVISNAQWSVQIEPDGSMLAQGTLNVEHSTPQPVRIDTPEGMTLLACRVDGHPVAPVDLGEGKLEIALPPPAKNDKSATVIGCSFTGRADPIDPLEGAMSLALPRTPLFIHTLSWSIALPPGYQAETNGNVTRAPRSSDDSPSVLRLRKNLCRDEAPKVRIFYHRADIR